MSVEGVVKVAPGPCALFICSIKKSVNRCLNKDSVHNHLPLCSNVQRELVYFILLQ